ncbi:zona pelucida superfamily protein qsm [Brevipalpus obovatus]|uniref:zona pelucida superfamily protein qsm n=1 Tax=Brevipalpus obovatus TaxID=246614 RepID=UPI003D9F8288
MTTISIVKLNHKRSDKMNRKSLFHPINMASISLLYFIVPFFLITISSAQPSSFSSSSSSPTASFASSTSSVTTSASTKPFVEIKCTHKSMRVTINLEGEDKDTVIYLDKLKGYPSCQPEKTENNAVFKLPLDEEFYACGTTRIQDKVTGTQIFYNKILIERPNNNTVQMVLPKCIIRSDEHSIRYRRQLHGNEWDFPANFTETVEELIDYSGNVTGRAPIPYLNIGVRQNGEFVDTALNVHPGTPLEMVIYLDETSAPVYGILGRYLKVTDNSPRKQEEAIIQEGCSVDPYIFSNFDTTEGGDLITAKFRAFKFPDSNYVLFVGTVNVCLKECLGVLCPNNQIGYGRRRRAIPSLPNDPNKMFEISMTAFLKVESMEFDGGPILKAVKALDRENFEDDSTNNHGDDLKSTFSPTPSISPPPRLRTRSRGESRSLPLRNSQAKDRVKLSTSHGYIIHTMSLGLFVVNLMLPLIMLRL